MCSCARGNLSRYTEATATFGQLPRNSTVYVKEHSNYQHLAYFHVVLSNDTLANLCCHTRSMGLPVCPWWFHLWLSPWYPLTTRRTTPTSTPPSPLWLLCYWIIMSCCLLGDIWHSNLYEGYRHSQTSQLYMCTNTPPVNTFLIFIMRYQTNVSELCCHTGTMGLSWSLPGR